MDPIDSTIDAKKEADRQRVIKLARKHSRVHEGDLVFSDDYICGLTTTRTAGSVSSE